MTAADAVGVRRRAVRLLAALAAALLLAGLLPWATGGETAARLLALPLLLAGLLVTGAALRIRAAGRRQPSAPPVERGCDGCACGAGSCATAGADPIGATAGATATGTAGATAPARTAAGAAEPVARAAGAEPAPRAGSGRSPAAG